VAQRTRNVSKIALAVLGGLLLMGGFLEVAAMPTHTTVATSSPFTVNHGFPVTDRVETLSGHQTPLAQGQRATIVLAMASWCRYCAYEDKWVVPKLAATPGVVIDIVDVSPQGGIGDPGPQSPAFSGHDGTGESLTVAQMETTMAQYVRRFGTLSAKNIHVYVAPTAIQSAWAITTYPSFAFLNSDASVVVAPNGAQTAAQAQADLQHVISARTGRPS